MVTHGGTNFFVCFPPRKGAACVQWRDGFFAIATSTTCPLPPNPNFTLARKSDALATAAKQRLVAAFNPLAKRFHRRTWSANEI